MEKRLPCSLKRVQCNGQNCPSWAREFERNWPLAPFFGPGTVPYSAVRPWLEQHSGRCRVVRRCLCVRSLTRERKADKRGLACADGMNGRVGHRMRGRLCQHWRGHGCSVLLHKYDWQSGACSPCLSIRERTRHIRQSHILCAARRSIAATRTGCRRFTATVPSCAFLLAPAGFDFDPMLPIEFPVVCGSICNTRATLIARARMLDKGYLVIQAS